MGRDALSKLQEAKEFDTLADGLKKRDPTGSRMLQLEANRKRRMAIKQLKRRPSRPSETSTRLDVR